MVWLKNTALLLVGLVLITAARDHATAEEEDPCLCRDLIVTCTVQPRTVVLGDPFEFCVTVQSVGATTLENVTLTIRGCPKAVPEKNAKLTLVIPKLARGETHKHCVRFRCSDIGECRLTAHATDSTKIAASGCICSAFCKGLPALQVEMIDTARDRSAKGIFKLGEVFMYRLSVENDVGSALTPDLRVRFVLPPELEFVTGRADGDTTVSGSGNEAASSRFVLRPNQRLILELECKVVKVPARSLVQTRATVITDPGDLELATETESTTLKR